MSEQLGGHIAVVDHMIVHLLLQALTILYIVSFQIYNLVLGLYHVKLFLCT